MNEDDHFRETVVSRVKPALVLRNVRRIASLHMRAKPNWVLAMEVFGLGSTYATRLCVEAGINPDGRK